MVLGVGDEVRGDVPAFKLHTLDNLELVLECLAVGDGDDTLLADLLHGARDEVADLALSVGGDGADLRNLLGGRDELSLALELRHHLVDRSLDPASEVHGVHARGDGLASLAEDGPGEHGGGGGAVARHVVGRGCNLLHQAGAQVHEPVGELDVLGDGDAVFRDLRRAEALLDDHVAALGAHGHLHRVRELVAALEHHGSRFHAKLDFLGETAGPLLAEHGVHLCERSQVEGGVVVSPDRDGVVIVDARRVIR